jgi:hypothetical protein
MLAKINTVRCLQDGKGESITSDGLTTSITRPERRLGLDRTVVPEVQYLLLRLETLPRRVKVVQLELEEELERLPMNSWVRRKEEETLPQVQTLPERVQQHRQLERLERKRRAELRLKDRDLFQLVGSKGLLPREGPTLSITTLERLPG